MSVHATRTIARVMGRRYGVNIVFGNIATAATDRKNIYVPANLSYIDNDEDMKLLEGLVDHEAMHCRFTNFDVKAPNMLIKNVANILEDVWGERQQSYVYPGAQINICRALEILRKRKGFFSSPQDNEEPVAVFSGAMIHILRFNILKQSIFEQTSPEWAALLESTFGKDVADLMVKTAMKVEKCRSTTRAMEIAGELVKILEQVSQGQSPQDPDEGQGQGSGQQQSGQQQSGQPGDPDGSDSEPGDGDSQSAGKDGDDEADQDGNPGGSADGDSGDEDGDADGKAGSGGSGQSGSGSSNQPTDAQQKAAKEALDSMSQNDIGNDIGDAIKGEVSESSSKAAHHGSGSGGNMEVQRFDSVISYDAELIRVSDSVRRNVGKKLEDLLEARVQEHRYNGISGRKLSRNFHTRLANADPRVFDRKEDQEGIDTAVTLVVDFSGSMDSSFGDRSAGVSRKGAAAAAMRAVCDCLDQVEIPFEIYCYGLSMTSFKRFDEPWKKHRDRWPHVSSAGSTQTAKALSESFVNLASRQEERKICLLLTDGIPDDPGATIAEMQAGKLLGIETAVTYITDDIRNIPGIFNAEMMSVATNPLQLEKAIFSSLEELI